MPLSEAEKRELLESVSDEEWEALRRAQKLAGQVQNFGGLPCVRCDCGGFKPGILFPLICRNDKCGHGVHEHIR